MRRVIGRGPVTRRTGLRTLLVDNYDSFTHNLAHYLTEVNHRPPVVLRNDDPAWHPGLLDEFDNVVISPGPGNPVVAADFGHCDEIIARTDLPLLGICLGHQGIAARYGGPIARLPEPWHGRLSAIEHTGRELFAGLPTPFQAVRYHSLHVADLPADLEPTAWTPDGLLMGLRHRTRPMWGVQFHPESICTEHGRELLRNFADLTRRHHSGRTGRSGRPRRSPGPATARPAAAPGRRRLRVLVESMPTRWDDEVVFDRLFRPADHAFWLDSATRDGHLGRFSILGDATGPLARVVRADTALGVVRVRSGQVEELVHEGFLDWLNRDLAGLDVTAPPLPGDFCLGWVGYLGYELKAECGGERAHRSPDPDAVMVFADHAVMLDHVTGTTYLLALVEDDDDAHARAWLSRTGDRLVALSGRAPRPPRPAHARPRAGELTLRHDREHYLDLIERCQEYIAAGESYEICLTNMMAADGSLDVWESYRGLRRASPAPFGALLRFGQLSVLSASPERFLRVGRDGELESRPIKGTRPRGRTPDEDAALREDLRTNGKDRAENLMIVDLVRNDLARCAVPGSVHVHRLFEVASYATVHQLVSTVRATRAADRTTVDCVRAAFPGGSMTGAPKIRSMRIVDELEGGARGVYSGAIGYLSLTGASDLNIVIRTAVVTPNGVRYGVGGAILGLSDPDAEFAETVTKARPLLELLGATFPGERRLDNTG